MPTDSLTRSSNTHKFVQFVHHLLSFGRQSSNEWAHKAANEGARMKVRQEKVNKWAHKTIDSRCPLFSSCPLANTLSLTDWEQQYNRIEWPSGRIAHTNSLDTFLRMKGEIEKKCSATTTSELTHTIRRHSLTLMAR